MKETPRQQKIEKRENHPAQHVVLSQSPSGLPAVELNDITPKSRLIIKRALAANMMDDLSYQMRKKVGAFLQGDSGGWMLIELWQGSTEEQQEFVDHLNTLLST